MGAPITGVMAAQRAKKRLPKGTATMTIEPRDAKPEDNLQTPALAQRFANMTEAQRKKVRLQRA